jgi:CubicO group peptidase (beta-lactamase class C family)
MAPYAHLRLSRRAALQKLGGATIGAIALSVGGSGVALAAPSTPTPIHTVDLDPVLGPIDQQLREMMKVNNVPGVAVGLLIDGQPHAAGWGVTNLDYPRPVDAATVFQIGSSTKPFTGAALARLVDQGKLDFDAPVRTYLSDFRVDDEDASERITVKHLVTHTSGFWGEEIPDGGRGDDALARMAPQLSDRPQVTPTGRFFGYNNAAVALAGDVLATVSGYAYEDAINALLLRPLGMGRSAFFLNDVIDYSVAAGHVVGPRGLQVERPFSSGLLTRSLAPTGGLLSTADDMLRWASFQLGDGRAGDGTPLLSRETLALTHHRLATAGGIGTDDYDGVGINWLLRNVGGVQIVEHGGTTPGQRARVLLAPEHNFAFVLLTNSPGGSAIRNDLTAWVLDHYLSVRQTPRTRMDPPDGMLSNYSGIYGVRPYWVPARVLRDGKQVMLQQLDDDGSPQGSLAPLDFYAPDRGVLPDGNLADFLRDDNGDVRWMRFLGRVFSRLSTE